MYSANRAWIAVPVLLLIATFTSVPASSQQPSPDRAIGTTQRIAVGDAIKGGDMNITTGSTDFAGEWVVYDEEERELGNFTGIPHNEAGRMRAETHDASEWRFRNFSAGRIRWSRSGAPPGRYVFARTWIRSTGRSPPMLTLRRGLDDRMIYLDGRPHPSEYAPHTWYGFSTGRFQGEHLVITTTHLKEGYFDWNGNSDKR